MPMIMIDVSLSSPRNYKPASCLLQLILPSVLLSCGFLSVSPTMLVTWTFVSALATLASAIPTRHELAQVITKCMVSNTAALTFVSGIWQVTKVLNLSVGVLVSLMNNWLSIAYIWSVRKNVSETLRVAGATWTFFLMSDTSYIWVK